MRPFFWLSGAYGRIRSRVPNSQDEIQRQRLAQSILATCVVRHGGVAALSKHLGVGEEKLLFWMGGKEVPPVEIVRRAIEPPVKES